MALRPPSLLLALYPGTTSEMSFAMFGAVDRPARFTTVRFATPVAGQRALTSSVMEDAKKQQITELAKVVEMAYCKAKPGYYSGDCRHVWLDDGKPRSLDMEFKFLQNEASARVPRPLAWWEPYGSPPLPSVRPARAPRSASLALADGALGRHATASAMANAPPDERRSALARATASI